MTEETGAVQTVEETLADAAVATDAVTEAKPKRVRKPKLDADGNPIPKAERKPKEPKEPKVAVPRATNVVLTLNGEPTTLHAIQNDAALEVVGNVGSKEGSKRAERAKALEGAATVQDFFAAGGLKKDILRHMLSGAVKVSVNGVAVVATKAEKPKAEEAAVEQASEEQAA